MLRDTNNAWKGPGTGTPPEIGVLASYAYDALGRRVETKEYVNVATGEFGGTATQPQPLFVTWHIYSGLENIQDWSWRGDVSSPGYYVKQQYLWGDSERFPEPVAMLTPFEAQTPDGEQPVEEKAWHYLHDVLGSVIGIVDGTGQLVERYTYDPYGKPYIEKWDSTANENEGAWVPSFEANSGLPYSPLGNPWMWTGQRYDPAVGLYAFLARTYSPVLGRFLQHDPIEYKAGTINLYEYANSSPLGSTDPLGLRIIVDRGSKKNPDEDFVRQVISALDKICPCRSHIVSPGTGEVSYCNAEYSEDDNKDCLEKHKAGCKLIDDLIKNKDTTKIKRAKKPQHQKGGRTKYRGLIVIRWDPTSDISDAYFKNGQLIVTLRGPSWAALTHEFVHAYDLETIGSVEQAPEGKVKKGETRAVRGENQVRSEYDADHPNDPPLEKRTTYTGDPVNDPLAPLF